MFGALLNPIIPNVSGAWWLMTFIDYCHWVTWTLLLKSKSDVSIVFPNFVTIVNNQFGVSNKRIRLANTKDYFNQSFNLNS